MELKHLKTFLYVADYLSYSKAAEELNFSQPAVSSHVQALERELGQKLFVSIGRKTYLTSAGAELKTYVDEVFATVSKIEQRFLGDNGKTKCIVIAAYETYCSINLPPLLSLFLQQYKDTNIVLRSCVTKEVEQGVRENRYDIGFISGRSYVSGIVNFSMSNDRMEIVVSRSIRERYTTEEILRELPYIKYHAEATFYNNDIERTLIISGFKPRKKMEFESLQAIKNAVLAGIGFTIMSADIIADELKNGSLIAITPEGVDVTSETSLIVLEEKEKYEEIRSFIATAKQNWR